MILPLPWLYLALLPQVTELVVTPSLPLPIALYAPTPEPGPVSSGALVEALSAAFKAGTAMDPVEVDAYAVASCRGSISCFLAADSAQEVMASAPLLLWVSKISSPAATRAGVTLIDVVRAKEILSRRLPDPDAQILDAAAIGSIDRTELLSSADLGRFTEQVLRTLARPALEPRGWWGARGAIFLSNPGVEADVLLDGVGLGRIARDGARLLGAPVGVHALVLEAPGFSTTTATVMVSARSETELHLRPELALSLARVERQAQRWTGVAGAILGITAITYAVSASTPTNTPDLCLSMECRRWVRIGGGISGHGGIPAVPVGVMLVSMGAVWFFGSLFEGEPQDLPWISLLGGAVLGGVELGVMLGAEKN